MQRNEQKIPDYDMGYKQVCSITEELLHFLQKYVKADWSYDLSPEQIAPYPNELYLPDYERRIPDLIFQILTEKETIICYMIIQLQSTIDFTMTFRFATELYGVLMKYFLQNKKENRERKNFQLPSAVPVLLYNGETEWSAVKSFQEYQKLSEKYPEHVLNFEYYIVDISRLNDDDILSSNYLIDNIIYLDKHRYDLDNLINKLSVVLQRIQKLPQDRQSMFWEWIEHVFVACIDSQYKNEVKQLIDNAKGEDSMFKYAITDMIEKSMAENFEKGKEEGFSNGMSQGISQGMLSESIHIVIQKLDQGLSADSIAYWLGKDPSFVHTIEELHSSHPEASSEQIMDYYTQALS